MVQDRNPTVSKSTIKRAVFRGERRRGIARRRSSRSREIRESEEREDPIEKRAGRYSSREVKHKKRKRGETLS